MLLEEEEEGSKGAWPLPVALIRLLVLLLEDKPFFSFAELERTDPGDSMIACNRGEGIRVRGGETEKKARPGGRRRRRK